MPNNAEQPSLTDHILSMALANQEMYMAIFRGDIKFQFFIATGSGPYLNLLYQMYFQIMR